MGDNPNGQRTEPSAEAVQLIVKETKELVRTLEGTAVSKVRIKTESFTIEVEREGGTIVAVAPVAGAAPVAAGLAPAASAPGAMTVVAPLVGVFYRSSSPGAKPLVEVGDTVERGQVVGIVEAMKVMNEVTSDYRGTVTEILVGDGEAVQFEQRLMLIDAAGK
ncbi:MAG: acetyl-CoA carboxylase biotin carboxyl carrier protein [Thermomicrobiales bacterium]